MAQAFYDREIQDNQAGTGTVSSSGIVIWKKRIVRNETRPKVIATEGLVHVENKCFKVTIYSNWLQTWEIFVDEKYEIKKETSWIFWTGVAVLVVGAALITGGAALVYVGATATFSGVGGAGAAIALSQGVTSIGVGTIGAGATVSTAGIAGMVYDKQRSGTIGQLLWTSPEQEHLLSETLIGSSQSPIGAQVECPPPVTVLRNP